MEALKHAWTIFGVVVATIAVLLLLCIIWPSIWLAQDMLKQTMTPAPKVDPTPTSVPDTEQSLPIQAKVAKGSLAEVAPIVDRLEKEMKAAEKALEQPKADPSPKPGPVMPPAKDDIPPKVVAREEPPQKIVDVQVLRNREYQEQRAFDELRAAWFRSISKRR